MTEIPLFATSLEPYRATLLARIAEIVDSGRFILGPEVEAFERDFADYLSVPHVIGVGKARTP